MRLKNICWLRLSLVAIAAFAVLFSGRFLWYKYSVVRPLETELQNTAEVENAAIQTMLTGSSLNITILLKNNASLPKVYSAISQKTALLAAGHQLSVEFRDHRCQELEQLYYDIHYYLQEAISVGNFPEMNAKVQQLSLGCVFKIS